MIRNLEKADYNIVCDIVNDNWKNVYNGFVNPELLNPAGCNKRKIELENDFQCHRFSEYVWEEHGKVLAMLSIGDTEDTDRTGAFEIWRIYITSTSQGKGLGGKLLAFAEQQAKENGYKEIVIWAFKENIRAVSFYQKHGYMINKEEYLGEPYLSYGVRLLKTL